MLFPHFLFFSLSLSLALSFFILFSLSLYLSISASLSLSIICLCLSLSLSFPLSLSLYLCLSVIASDLSASRYSKPPHSPPKSLSSSFATGETFRNADRGATNLFCITARKLFLFLCFFLVHTGEMLIAKFSIFHRGDASDYFDCRRGNVNKFVIRSHRLPHGQC